MVMMLVNGRWLYFITFLSKELFPFTPPLPHLLQRLLLPHTLLLPPHPLHPLPPPPPPHHLPPPPHHSPQDVCSSSSPLGSSFPSLKLFHRHPIDCKEQNFLRPSLNRFA